MTVIRVWLWVWLVALSGTWATSARAHRGAFIPPAEPARAQHLPNHDSPPAPKPTEEGSAVISVPVVDVWDASAGRTASVSSLTAASFPPVMGRLGRPSVPEPVASATDPRGQAAEGARGEGRGYLILICRQTHAPPGHR